MSAADVVAPRHGNSPQQHERESRRHVECKDGAEDGGGRPGEGAEVRLDLESGEQAEENDDRQCGDQG